MGDAEQEPFLLAPVSAKTVSDAIEKGWAAFFSQGCYGRHRVSAAGTPAHDPSHVASKFTEGDLASLVAPDASRNPLTGVSSGCIGGSQRWRVFTTPRGEVMLVLPIVGWFIVSCILISFIEHQVHSKLMHRRNFLSRHYAGYKRIFEGHALVHHQHYSKIFSDEPVAVGEDKEIRLTLRKAPIKAIPFAAAIALVSWQGAAVFVAAMYFHHWAWNKVHLEMHKPEQRIFSTWPIYKFLARYHWLHHRYQDRNFNVVFPLADYVLGTNARANALDLKYMQQLGLR